MTDLEINRALALAIGWNSEAISASTLSQNVYVHSVDADGYLGFGRRFDYRDWSVSGPIAAKYDCFPQWGGHFKWCSRIDFSRSWGDTPQLAIALAVIGAET